ncbi:MAG: hypothetical protein KatS3mg028_1691 [Bacteroidia bacterium]|nr:MAG: hypothetical protein KatS3mg028_1691 [Bacteroidia bacterium]
MKKFYLLTSVLFLASSSFAQNRTVGEAQSKTLTKLPMGASVKTPTDTIASDGTDWFSTLSGWSPTIYGSANGGYVAGHNGYGDKTKAQKFVYSPIGTNYKVEGALLWIGGYIYTSNNPNSKVVVKVYNSNGNGTASSGSVTDAPGASLGSADLLINSIDTSAMGANGFVVVTFPTPVAVTQNYYIGVDLTPTAAGDTIGIVSSADGEATIQDFSWEQWSDNSWHSFLEAWPLDIDLAIFAIISDPNNTGIDDLGYTNGLRFQTYPNPAVDNVNVTYDLTENANITIEIRDLNGRLIKNINKGSQMPGRYVENINVSDLSAGQYFISVNKNNKRLFKKINIVK